MNQEGVQYSVDETLDMAMTICQFNERMEISKAQVAHQFLTTYSLKKAMQKFGQQGYDAAVTEMQQLKEKDVVLFQFPKKS
jgi:putative NADPH-quinone reductase